MSDRKVLRLIRNCLEAGVMAGGAGQPTAEGAPQGSPLSPLLPDVMPGDLDRELRKRGHRFTRCAGDLRVFVRSERAARRVPAGVTGVIGQRLKLKVNQQKSPARHAAQATLPGSGFSLHGPQVTITVAPRAVTRLKDQLRTLAGRRRGVTTGHRTARLSRFTVGWMACFRTADTGNLVRETGRRLRRRLRQARWREWKTTASRRHNLRIRGIPERNVRKRGGSSKGYRRIAGPQVLSVALPNAYRENLGLKTMTAARRRFTGTA